MEKPTFAPEFWQDLARENPMATLTITEQDARDWFDLEWPPIREYYAAKYPRTKRPNWRRRLVVCWLHLTDDKLRKAREFGIAARRSQQGAKLDALAQNALSDGLGGLDDEVELPPMNSGGWPSVF